MLHSPIHWNPLLWRIWSNEQPGELGVTCLVVCMTLFASQSFSSSPDTVFHQLQLFCGCSCPGMNCPRFRISVISLTNAPDLECLLSNISPVLTPTTFPFMYLFPYFSLPCSCNIFLSMCEQGIPCQTYRCV